MQVMHEQVQGEEELEQDIHIYGKILVTDIFLAEDLLEIQTREKELRDGQEKSKEFFYSGVIIKFIVPDRLDVIQATVDGSMNGYVTLMWPAQDKFLRMYFHGERSIGV